MDGRVGELAPELGRLAELEDGVLTNIRCF
jgi:hypothetical protein